MFALYVFAVNKLPVMHRLVSDNFTQSIISILNKFDFVEYP